MTKGWLRHSFEFILIFGVLISAIILLEIFKSSLLRLEIITFASIFYVGVGIFHHWEEKTLSWKPILEHIAIGSFIFLVLQAVYK